MLQGDDDLTAGFLDTSSTKFLFTTRTVSPVYTNQFDNPWGGETSFEPETHTNILTPRDAVEDALLSSGITPAMGVDVPELYDTAYIRSGPTGDRVSLESLERVMGLGGVTIIGIVVPPGSQYVTRNEFNTALALVACAQKHMDVSLETVQQHRNDLPELILANIDTMYTQRTPISSRVNGQRLQQTRLELQKQQQQQRIVDPWVTTRPLIQNENTPNHYNPEDLRPTIPTNPQELIRSRGINPSSTATTINNNNNNNNNNFITSNNNNNTTTTTTTTTTSATTLSNKRHLADKLPSEAHQWFAQMDRVRVDLMEEKEGFLFKHANYKIESEQHNCSVLRRYSDFCWLAEMLLKRYPLRMLPTLPPKQSSHTTERFLEDEVFLERRRKGLERFLGSIVRHPILAKDELVAVFLTESSALRTWLRSHSPLIEEEFMHQHLSFEEVERRVPDQLDLQLETLRKRLEPLTQLYHTLCSQMERMIRLEEAQAAEFDHYSATLNAMCTLEQACYVPECLPCGFVIHGYESVSKHMQRAGQIQNDQTLVTRYTTLENLRRQRDLLISFKEMLDRRDRLVPSVPTSKAKRDPDRESESYLGTPRVSAQQQRRTFVQYCLASEISFLHKHQAFVSQLYQDYAFEQIKYERKLSDNWKILQVLASEMPSEPDDFA
ncbi:hypothetical protein PHYBLDRAFT_149927 [Phycomyces blakesleeanus NRRL 1555(-)]|uniref:Sorting nexin MVP1 n=1 Tax=Phycomyces blakesleeanus (strain ATCC 8743b / DSM 1359 / FGSC 10004 / NBRC 33097 / NRRL 1555) TaxID=763407 RepID=A0A162WLR9_PHYB8|nr:hypothetical protein PHYBLDRAFT_149927 [Phycomyces blakesleeanus NRRL 1555(-)]OAD68925.1 hypothetical protein PHYBLDRAFT_149927 [Phycomyces blakesleeanus NRRL 1555(-)]|eukprot:XP_018286965.1 hypothetical protein PHYBLDRAFT_149927 [Phycomyces blakesleeanus NRRL 1555(-)]